MSMNSLTKCPIPLFFFKTSLNAKVTGKAELGLLGKCCGQRKYDDEEEKYFFQKIQGIYLKNEIIFLFDNAIHF